MLQTQYKFPLHIFLIFEKIETTIFINNKLTPNHYCLIILPKWFFIFQKILKNELFTSSNSILEMSSIDNLFFNKNINNVFYNSRRFTLFTNYYLYFLKTKLSVLDRYT